MSIPFSLVIASVAGIDRYFIQWYGVVVLAGLSVCQLIFMSEVGVLMLRSSLPLSFIDRVLIFLLRTAIALPLLMLGAQSVV